MTERVGLARDFTYYLAHQDELVKQYDGKVVVIKDGKVLGAYDSLIKAVTETEKAGQELGTFLVQPVSPGSDAYTHTHHSRVLRA